MVHRLAQLSASCPSPHKQIWTGHVYFSVKKLLSDYITIKLKKCIICISLQETSFFLNGRKYRIAFKIDGQLSRLSEARVKYFLLGF